MHRYRARIWSIALALSLLTAPLFAAETAMVPMRDGTKLATDVHLPDGEGPWPVLLARSVYGRGGDLGKGLAGAVHAQGYAFVIQDTRGRGESEGEDAVFADDAWGDRQDGADTVAWIRQQPWCDGHVGTFGGSALGITQVMLAAAGADVDIQSIVVACSNMYGQMSYQGGVWRKNMCEKWLEMQGNAHIIDLWKSHPSYDIFWKQMNAEDRAGYVTAPGLHIGGWWDIFNQGTINNFVTRQHHGGEGARGNQVLVMGPWPHGQTQEFGDLKLQDDYKFDTTALEQRLYAHFLKGEQNGVMDEPPVHYYVIGDLKDPEAPGNEWRTAEDWPPFPTVEREFYLGSDGALTAQPAQQEAQLAYTYDPADPCPTQGGQNLLLPAGPLDQREVSGRADVLQFATAPLEVPLEITGRVKVRLFVSSDAPDTDFTAKLVDIYPDGSEILMLDSIQRLKFRNGFEQPEPLPVGEVGEVTIDLWSISLIVNKGHRIGVQISSSNYPRFEKNPNTGEDFPTEGNLRVARNMIHMGGIHTSALVVDVPAEVTE